MQSSLRCLWPSRWAKMMHPLGYRAKESCHYAAFMPDGFRQACVKTLEISSVIHISDSQADDSVHLFPVGRWLRCTEPRPLWKMWKYFSCATLKSSYKKPISRNGCFVQYMLDFCLRSHSNLMDKIHTALEKKVFTYAILDLSKVFDSVHQDILLAKLY